MTVKSICHSYWRLVKAGRRTFESIPKAEDREMVKYLAKTDVANNVITEEEYEHYIGEPYSPIEEEE